MKSLKTLVAALSLTLVFGVTAFAGDPTPPCNPDPGITSTPPCASAQMTPDDSEAPAETTAGTASTETTNFSVVDVTIALVQSALLLF